MTAQLARMTQVLIVSPSTTNVGTTTKLHQSITIRMADAMVPSGEGVAAQAADKIDDEEGVADAGN